ncbi:MAG: phosphatidate cytidylyltransferase [Nitrospiraceae bacterium]
MRRVYPALVFVPLFYFLVRYLSVEIFFALVVIVGLLSVTEFYRLYFREHRAPLHLTVGLGSTALLFLAIQWPTVISERTALVAAVGGALTAPLLSRRALAHSLLDSAVLLFGVLYVGLALGHLLLTRARPGGEMLILGVILITWASDTGAYFAGRMWGRHRLAPMISPNKTIEGLVGGLSLAVTAACVARAWFLPSLSLLDCVALGVLLTAAGVLGDLTESALKRSAGVKDSGSLIPGHGGMLDRVDSLLFTAPMFYYYLTLIKA